MKDKKKSCRDFKLPAGFFLIMFYYFVFMLRQSYLEMNFSYFLFVNIRPLTDLY